MFDFNIYTINNFLLLSTLILFIFVLVLISGLERIHKNLEGKIRGNPEKLKKRANYLREIEKKLKKQKYELRGKEGQRVLDEMKKISNLWRSKKESLRKSFWGGVEDEPDELKKLQDDKERIEELIKNTKTKYHKREIDEESFREIVKDYQKELVEINVRIEEMKRGRHT